MRQVSCRRSVAGKDALTCRSTSSDHPSIPPNLSPTFPFSCWAGKASPNAGANAVTDCVECSAGQYQNAPGQTECTAYVSTCSLLQCRLRPGDCAVLLLSSQILTLPSSPSPPLRCVAGQWQEGTGSILACTLCVAGKKSTGTGQVAEDTCTT